MKYVPLHLIASSKLHIDGAVECKRQTIDLSLKVDVATATYEINASTITHFNACIFTAVSSPLCDHCIVGASLLSDTQTQSRPEIHIRKCYLLLNPLLSETVRLSLISVISGRWRTETQGSGDRMDEKVITDSPAHTVL